MSERSSMPKSPVPEQAALTPQTTAQHAGGNAGFIQTYRRAEPLFVKGEGAWVEDDTGRRWLDLLSGIGCTALGHGHPALVAALSDQAGKLVHTSNLFRHGPGEELSVLLCELTGMHGAFFSNSGAEANECALKLARKYQQGRGAPERTHFVALDRGFHGRTLGSVSVTSNTAYRAPFAPTFELQLVAPEDTGALAAALDHGPAALIVEPIQGEGGVHVLSADFLRAAREQCDATGTVLIHDEVQCGVGRTGTFLAADAAGVSPDVVTLAKPIAAGLPMGVTLARDPFAQVLQPGDHGSTFGGGPMAARAALVLLEELDHGLGQNIQERGAQLADGLDSLAERYACVGSPRGQGLMRAIPIPGKAAAVQAALFEAGVISGTTAGDVLRFLPPYIVTENDIATGLERLERVLASL